LGHPSYFQQLPRLRSVTARQSSSERQPNFAALNRRRHLCSAGRPSRWALAHISSYISIKDEAVSVMVVVGLVHLRTKVKFVISFSQKSVTGCGRDHVRICV